MDGTDKTKGESTSNESAFFREDASVMGIAEYLLLILAVLGLPGAIFLSAGIWLVRTNRSAAHHLVGVIFSVLGLLLLVALLIGVGFGLLLIPVEVVGTNGTEPIPTMIPAPSPTATSGGGT